MTQTRKMSVKTGHYPLFSLKMRHFGAFTVRRNNCAMGSVPSRLGTPGALRGLKTARRCSSCRRLCAPRRADFVHSHRFAVLVCAPEDSGVRHRACTVMSLVRINLAQVLMQVLLKKQMIIKKHLDKSL